MDTTSIKMDRLEMDDHYVLKIDLNDLDHALDLLCLSMISTQMSEAFMDAKIYIEAGILEIYMTKSRESKVYNIVNSKKLQSIISDSDADTLIRSIDDNGQRTCVSYKLNDNNYEKSNDDGSNISIKKRYLKRKREHDVNKRNIDHNNDNTILSTTSILNKKRKT